MMERIFPMPEHHTAENADKRPCVAVQFDPNGSDVGIGLEATVQSDGTHHLFDFLMDDRQTQQQIGITFLKLIEQNGWELRYKEGANVGTSFSEFAIARTVMDAVTGSTSEVGTALFTRLDRGGVNRLIRLLRKARDTAFGRDE